jgi:hypothetical protein
MVLTDPELVVGVRHIVWNDFPVSKFQEALRALPQCKVEVHAVQDDFNRIAFQIEGCPSAEEIERCANHLFIGMRQITRSYLAPTWSAGIDGVTQLFFTAFLEFRMRGTFLNAHY